MEFNPAITTKFTYFNFFIPLSKLSGSSLIYKLFEKNNKVRVVTNQYGKLEQRMKLLTEYHLSVIMAIIQYGEITVDENGNYCSIFKEIDILRALKMGDKNYHHLRKVVKDITDANFYIEIDSIRVSENAKIIEKHSIDKDENAQRVVFHDAFVRVHKSEFSVNLKPIMPKINEIPYPTIMSILFYLIFKNKTNSIKTYKLQDVLLEIGFPIESLSSFRALKRNLVKYKDELEDKFNTVYDDKNHTFYYSKMDEIEFRDSIQDETRKLDAFIDTTIRVNKKPYTILKIEAKNTEKTSWDIITDKGVIKKEIFISDLVPYLKIKTNTKEK